MPEQIGKYRILERIGRGGMGTIFKAHDPVLDRPVALKMFSSEVEVTDELRALFFREAQACARLSHPNIVTVHDMGEHEGRLYIVMELLEGDELRGLIAQKRALALIIYSLHKDRLLLTRDGNQLPSARSSGFRLLRHAVPAGSTDAAWPFELATGRG